MFLYDEIRYNWFFDIISSDQYMILYDGIFIM
jgi:hypothetical protein